MKPMTTLLLASCCVLPLQAFSCDKAGATVWVNLQLANTKQVQAQWPMLEGHYTDGTICIDRKQLVPQPAQAGSVATYIQPASDLLIHIDNARQTIKAEWQLDIQAAAGLPVLSASGKSLQPSCVVQHVSFRPADAAVQQAGHYAVSTQAQNLALHDCQGSETIKAGSIDRQWILAASFLVLDGKQAVADTEKNAAEKPQQATETKKTVATEKTAEEKKDIGGKMKEFFEAHPADEDAKKRMKKR